MSRQSFWKRPLNWSFILGLVCLAISAATYFIGYQSGGGGTFTVSLVFLCLGLILTVAGVAIRYELELVAQGLWQRIQLSELARKCERVGLADVDTQGGKFAYDYSEVLSESRGLVIVLNDGRTWASVQRDNLRSRFEDPSKETTVILSHPESDMLRVLARKGSTDVETIKGRILQTVKLLEEIKGPATSLEILGHHLFNPFSLIVTDDAAIVVPYFLSRGGRTVPVFKFEDVGENCYFRKLTEDVERLRMDAHDISSSSKNRDLSDAGGVVRLHSR